MSNKSYSAELDFVLFLGNASPILFIILYLLFPERFIQVSLHPLGKIIAIMAILITTYQNMLYGVLISFMVILYYTYSYSSDITDSFLSNTGNNYVDFIPEPSDKKSEGIYDGIASKSSSEATTVDEAYPNTLAPIQKVKEVIFRKKKCDPSTAKVHYKDNPVKNNYVSHVYSELDFRDGECNPCDKTCHFTIQEKQAVENDLKTPKSSNENVLWEMVTSMISSTEEPFVVFNNQVASTI